MIRAHVNRHRSTGDTMSDEAISSMLWERFGNDPAVLNDLAFEYLAEGTDHLAMKVAQLTFVDPVAEIPERIGIDRTKAFAGLSTAMGASPEKTAAAITASGAATVYDYLAELDHQRFLAVSRRSWINNTDLLEEMIESSPPSPWASSDKWRNGGRI
ncbi:MAG: hypothetical protein JW829_19640 [Pirellulales bacterium]|nr:hypothetical protein [Pirellulales bacterium]